MAKQRGSVKCEGRFSQLRQYLYDHAVPLAMEDRTLVTKQDLSSIWDLIQDEVFNFDRKDPYYENNADRIRRKPNLDYLSLVPLVETPNYGLESGLIRSYSKSMGNNSHVSEMLETMNDKPLKFFREIIGRKAKTIIFPGTKINLSDYLVSADIGVGTLVEGGHSGGGVRSDSPFILGLNHLERRGQRNLAAVVGFWAFDNTMLVSQIQSCRNANLPRELTLGEGCLYLAEVAAREMGFNQIATYSAREHPMFKEHSEDWAQMGKDFVPIFDSSAKKLGYNGSRHGYHLKDLNNGHSQKRTVTSID